MVCIVANLSLVFYPQKCPAPQSALKTTCSESMVPNLLGGPSQKRSSTAHHKISHPASSKARSAAPLPEANVTTPEHQDSCGSVPVQVFVPLPRSSEDLSLPPQPPPPLPPPPPPLPPPPPPALSSFQTTSHHNLRPRTLAAEDQPLPLVCGVPAEGPCAFLEDFRHPGNPCSPALPPRGS